MIKNELDEILQLAERYRHETNEGKLSECAEALRLLVELIQDLRVLIDIRHEKEKNNTKGQNQ